MSRVVVLNVVGLSQNLLGTATPFLNKLVERSGIHYIRPPLPAVTTTVQTAFLTGKSPAGHGIVGNGWYCRDECEVKFWKQSNRLVDSAKIWHAAKKIDPTFTCANICWWYNMYSDVDYSVTPRPVYCADGRKIPDCYTEPADLRYALTEKLGPFPLFKFWGPSTSIEASQWIADTAIYVEEKYSPTLSLVYLPHLDYCLQKHGSNSKESMLDLQQIDTLCEQLVRFFEQRDVKVVLLSEYGITEVNQPVHLNRLLRREGFLRVREELGLELLDAGASRAFAVADHQVAHVYVKDPVDIPAVRQLLEACAGVDEVWGDSEKQDHGLDHSRSGELIAIAEKKSWFTYYYWLDDSKAPDFARTVDIHRKPGYDPVELFLDESNPWIKEKLLYRIMQKKLGLRALLDVIPLDATLVKGSHGRYPDSPQEGPLLISPHVPTKDSKLLDAKDIYSQLLYLISS